MSDSPTTLTLKLFQMAGYKTCKVEYFNYYAKRRFDLFGFADIVAVREGAPIAAIQCSTMEHATERKQKIESIAAAHIWKDVGSVFLVSWRKLKVNQLRKYKTKEVVQAKAIQVPRVELLMPGDYNPDRCWREIEDWETEWMASMRSSFAFPKRSASLR